jgi:hypothetical protein
LKYHYDVLLTSYYMTVYHVLIFDIFILVSRFNSSSMDLIVGHVVASSVNIDVKLERCTFESWTFLFVYCWHSPWKVNPFYIRCHEKLYHWLTLVYFIIIWNSV